MHPRLGPVVGVLIALPWTDVAAHQCTCAVLYLAGPIWRLIDQ
jgi:hypothetical protein